MQTTKSQRHNVVEMITVRQRYTTTRTCIILGRAKFSYKVFRQLASSSANSARSILRFYTEQFWMFFCSTNVVSTTDIKMCSAIFFIYLKNFISVVFAPRIFEWFSDFARPSMVLGVGCGYSVSVVRIVFSTGFKYFSAIVDIPLSGVFRQISFSTWDTPRSFDWAATFFTESHLNTLHGKLVCVGNSLVKQRKDWPVLSRHNQYNIQ